MIKEVADVTFYELDENGNPSNPVLYLDTLKVSTIEQTGEQADATGGKGNAPLIIWDYGKEINVTLEDALFSPKSLAIMFGDGTVDDIPTYTGTGVTNAQLIMKTEQFIATSTTLPTSDSASGWSSQLQGPDGKMYKKINPKFFDEKGGTPTSLALGQKYFCTYDIQVDGSVIEISATSFPGTYYVTGDTYARSEANGKDELNRNSSLAA